MDPTPPRRLKLLENPSPIAETLIAAANNDDIQEDRISNLPDSILCHILSKLPTKDAIATIILSTKWKHRFASIPNLFLLIDDAVSHSNTNFVNFMYHLLTVTLLDVPSIRKFLLCCNRDYGIFHHDAWISAVLGLKVSDLYLFFFVEDTGVSIESLFECETLVNLIWSQHFYANVPDTVCLPNLKFLSLVNVKFPDFHSFDSLISGCSVLEDLCLDSCKFEETYSFGVCSPSLKFLRLNNCKPNDRCEVVIHTPLLESLYYNGHVAESYGRMNLSSLLQAHINIGPSHKQVEDADDDEDLLWCDQNVAKLVVACYNVQYLYLSKRTVAAIHRSSYAMPTFHNMTTLKLGDLNIHGWEFLPHLLESAPNLENLVFGGSMVHEWCFAKFESSIPNRVPTCLSLHLQSISFEEFNGDQDELELVSYFLTTAEVLREIEFSFCSSLPIVKKYKSWSKLSSLEGSSKSKNCKIHFANL